MRVAHHKLVRDQIPGIIAAAGRQPVTRVLDQAVYQAALRTKLLEEAREAPAAPDGQLASELADVLEVLKALAAAYDMSWEDVVSEADRKRADRGAFSPIRPAVRARSWSPGRRSLSGRSAQGRSPSSRPGTP